MKPNKIMFLDLEVNNKEYFGAVASPKHEDNYVVMQGYAIESVPYEGEIEYKYYENKEQAEDWFKVPDDVWLIVAHNLPFELDWAFTQCREELVKFVQRGGKFWCTQLAQYRLSRQTETFPSLNDTAIQHGGNTKLDLVSLEWKNGKLTNEIDPTLLKDYLIGYESDDGFVEGDIGNTRLAFYGQYMQMQEREMLKVFMAQMDGLVFNSICMSFGLKLDRDTAMSQLEALRKDAEETDKLLKSMLYNIPEEARDQFNFGSMHHRSAWLYGGAFKYEGREETFNKDGSPKWEKKSVVKCDDLYEGTLRVVAVEGLDEHEIEELFSEGKYEPTRYKSGKNKGKIKVERIDSDVRATRKCDVTVDVVGILDLSVYPKEFIKEFDKNCETKLELADGSRVMATSEDVVSKFIEQPKTSSEVKEVLKTLLKRYRLDKILGTFYLTQKLNTDGSVRKESGMLQYLTDDGYIYHSLNATSTVTGRLSCTRPNLQQLPRDGFGGVKNMFVSRFGADGVIVEIDYSNLEVITLANFSRDPFLMKQITEGMNAHNINSAWKLGITYEEFMEVYENEEHPLYAEYDELRSDMKGYEFLYNYGGGVGGLVFTKGCTQQEAEAFIKYKEESLAGVTKYYEGVEQFIRDHAENFREMRDNKWQFAQRSYFKADGGFEYSYRTYETTKWENGTSYKYQDFKIPQIKNYHIQGESSVMVQIATGKIIRYLFENNFFDFKMIPILTTHDSVSLDVHKDVLDKVKEICDIMEGVSEWMKPFGYDLPLPYSVEATAGSTMQDQHKL